MDGSNLIAWVVGWMAEVEPARLSCHQGAGLRCPKTVMKEGDLNLLLGQQEEAQ